MKLHTPNSASAIPIVHTKRALVRGRRLPGRFQLRNATKIAAGAVKTKKYKPISVTSGISAILSATESQRIRRVSSEWTVFLLAPVLRQVAHHVSPPKSRAHNAHRKRPQREHDVTARLVAW